MIVCCEVTFSAEDKKILLQTHRAIIERLRGRVAKNSDDRYYYAFLQKGLKEAEAYGDEIANFAIDKPVPLTDEALTRLRNYLFEVRQFLLRRGMSCDHDELWTRLHDVRYRRLEPQLAAASAEQDVRIRARDNELFRWDSE